MKYKTSNMDLKYKRRNMDMKKCKKKHKRRKMNFDTRKGTRLWFTRKAHKIDRSLLMRYKRTRTFNKQNIFKRYNYILQLDFLVNVDNTCGLEITGKSKVLHLSRQDQKHPVINWNLHSKNKLWPPLKGKAISGHFVNWSVCHPGNSLQVTE